MADLFATDTENVLDTINHGDDFKDDFTGDLFNGADSNFLGIAIGKKAKARKAAKRADRQAGRKYKLETERIRALQGQPKQNVIKDITDGLGKVAGAAGNLLSGNGGANGGFDEAYPQNQQPDSYPQPTPKSNNTILYAIIAVVVVLGAVILMKK